MPTLNQRVLFAALLMVLSAPFSTARANANAIDLPWRTGMVPGRGFDSAKASSDGLNFALDPASIGMDKLGPAVCPFERKFDMELVDSVREYERKVGIAAEAEIDVVVATATGTLTFAHRAFENSESVYLMIRDERVNCHYRLKNPKLSSDAERRFGEDYPGFRARYGDRFLSTVSTGGNFYAVMEIKRSFGETREELKFKVKAKVMGVTVFSWGMEEAFEDIMAENETRISVYSNNSTYESGVTKERMFELYAEYLGTVTSPACSAWPAAGRVEPPSPGECPYRRASFEDFQQITRLAPGSTAQQAGRMAKLAQQTTIMNELAERRRAYADLEARAAAVEIHLGSYAYPRPQDEALKFQKVQGLRAAAREKKETLEDAYAACVADVMTCTPPVQLAPSEMALEREFPVRVDRYPDTCKALRARYDLRRDGPVQLYFQGKRSQPFEAYCTAMEGTDPQTYLVFRVSSPGTARPGVNFARRIAAPDLSLAAPRAVTSVLSGLHVRFLGGKALVMAQDAHLVTDIGGPIPDGALETRHAEVFALETCDAAGERHLANLSLAGTPWGISSQNVYLSDVPPGSDGGWSVSPDRKRLDAYGEGRTGCVKLSVQGSLTLEYQP